MSDLATENELLKERIAWLEDTFLGKCINFPYEWRLTKCESKIMRALMAREVLSKEAAMVALYGDRPGDEPDETIIAIFIHKIRRKLIPFNIAIRTHWGQGWSIESHLRKSLKAGAA